MRFQKELTTFKNKCEKPITISNENSKIHVENLEKEIRRKDNIIDQFLLDLQKISTQSARHPQAEVSVDQKQNLAIQKLEVPYQNKKITLITS